jgi:hypothetical protein
MLLFGMRPSDFTNSWKGKKDAQVRPAVKLAIEKMGSWIVYIERFEYV